MTHDHFEKREAVLISALEEAVDQPAGANAIFVRTDTILGVMFATVATPLTRRGLQAPPIDQLLDFTPCAP